MISTTTDSTIGHLLDTAAGALGGVSETPRLDAEILLAHALGQTRSALLARLGERVSPEMFPGYVDRRSRAEPIAYIIGEWEFYSLPFFVRAPVLVPRPETEHLVEAVLDHAGNREQWVCEIGTGTGCVAVSVLFHAPNVRAIGTDCRRDYMELTEKNARRHAVEERLELRTGDAFAALEAGDGPFDAIIANPPYIGEDEWEGLPRVIRDYEDRNAVIAGANPLEMVRRIAAGAPAHVKPGGLLALELGLGQFERAADVLTGHGFTRIGARKDLAGIDRVITGIWPG